MYRNNIKEKESLIEWDTLPYDVKIAITHIKPNTSPTTNMMSFMDLYDMKSYDKAWESQKYFDNSAVFFLLHARKDNSIVYDYFKKHVKAEDDGIYEKLSFLAASGYFCKLAKTYVPKLLDWKIREYDGKESIVLL